MTSILKASVLRGGGREGDCGIRPAFSLPHSCFLLKVLLKTDASEGAINKKNAAAPIVRHPIFFFYQSEFFFFFRYYIGHKSLRNGKTILIVC